MEVHEHERPLRDAANRPGHPAGEWRAPAPECRRVSPRRRTDQMGLRVSARPFGPGSRSEGRSILPRDDRLRRRSTGRQRRGEASLQSGAISDRPPLQLWVAVRRTTASRCQCAARFTTSASSSGATGLTRYRKAPYSTASIALSRSGWPVKKTKGTSRSFSRIARNRARPSMSGIPRSLTMASKGRDSTPSQSLRGPPPNDDLESLGREEPLGRPSNGRLVVDDENTR